MVYKFLNEFDYRMGFFNYAVVKGSFFFLMVGEIVLTVKENYNQKFQNHFN